VLASLAGAALVAGQAGALSRRPGSGRWLGWRHLPDADRPAIVAQALAAATAITDDDFHARARTGLAPHLPADLLAQALGSAPRTAPQALMALLERGQALTTQGSRLAYVRLLRDCLNGINRQACLNIVVSAVSAIIETSGGGGYQAMCTCSDGCISMVAMRAADHHSAAQPRDDLVLNCADKGSRNNLGVDLTSYFPGWK
jgi:hypothetical protein